jgi:hypothetical protein
MFIIYKAIFKTDITYYVQRNRAAFTDSSLYWQEIATSNIYMTFNYIFI